MNSLIRKSVQSLHGYVPGEQFPADKYIKLNTNENPYPPSPAVAGVLAKMAADKLRLYPDPVSTALREKIATLHGCEISNVFVGNGSDEVLALCTRAFVENDGSIGYFTPSYSLYPVLAAIRDVEMRETPLDKDFRWPFRRGSDMANVRGNSLFLMANPNAPTGMLAAEDDVRWFCEWAQGVVVIDEAYVDFACNDCLHLALELDNVLVARTLSKSYSLAGLRVGYAVGAEHLVQAMAKIKDSYNMDALSQQLALAAVSDVDHMRMNAERIKTTRARLRQALVDMGHKVYPAEANFVWVEPTGIAACELYEELKEQHILVRYFPGERTGNCVRITVGADKDVDALLLVIGRLIENKSGS